MNDDGEIVRTIPMTQPLRSVLDNADQGYMRIFGRQAHDTDPIFLGQYLYSEQDVARETADAMRRAGTRPEIIYAYEKTGLIVSESNVHLAPTKDLEEWESAIDEYFSREDKLSPEDIAWKDIYSELEHLIITFGYILEHGGKQDHKPELKLSKILSLEEYVIICATRSFKTLRSIRYLLDKEIGADSLALARSVYESYLHIVFVKAEPTKLEDLVDARHGLRTGTHEHPKTRAGVSDRRVIVCKGDGRRFEGSISKYRMAAASPEPEDLEIFVEMYEFLSEFTHPAFVTAYLATNESQSLDARTNEHQFEALLYAVLFGTFLLDQMRTNPLIRNDAVGDIGIVVSRIRDNLINLIDNVVAPEGSRQFDLLKARLGRVGVGGDRADA